MTLGLYLARRFALSFLAVLAVFVGLMMLIDMVEQVRRFETAGITLARAAGLAALNVPSTIYGILPLIVVLAAVAMFLALARSSELVVIRAAGRSGVRAVVPPALSAMAIGVFAVAVLNPIVAGTSRQYDAETARLLRGGANVLSVSGEGLWLREAGAGRQSVIRAASTNPDGTLLRDVTFIAFADGTPVERIAAAEAQLAPGAWHLRDAKVWDLTAPNPEASASRHPEFVRPSTLTANQIRDSFGAPSAIPIWDLPGFIAQLEAAGFSARRHRVWLQMELAAPLLYASMVIIGAAFTMRHSRLGQTGQMVLLAILAAFGLFFLRNFAQVLGDNGQIPVALAAWSPPVAALLLGAGILLQREDG